MRPFALASLMPLVFILAIGAGEPSPEPEEGNDAKTILGTWEAVRGAKDGMPLPASEVNGLKMKFTRGSVVVIMPNMKDRQETAKYKLNQKPKPREMDILINEMGGQTVKSIYKFEKGQFTLCFGKPGMDRPKSFDEKLYAVLVMRKEKAAK